MTSCSLSSLQVSHTSDANVSDGLYVRRILLHKQPHSFWDSSKYFVCYVELKESRLQGVSCQNDLSFIVFSGGYHSQSSKNLFEIEKSNPLFSDKKVQFIMDLLRIDLFRHYQISQPYKVIKSNQKTLLMQKGEKVAEVER